MSSTITIPPLFQVKVPYPPIVDDSVIPDPFLPTPVSPNNGVTYFTPDATPEPLTAIDPVLPAIPPLPFLSTAVDQLSVVRDVLSDWVGEAIIAGNGRNTHTISAMADQLIKLFEEKARLEPAIEALKTKFEALQPPKVKMDPEVPFPGLECESCGSTPLDPYLLCSCRHITCGRCLDRQWRPVLAGRMRDSTATSENGAPLLVLLHHLARTEGGWYEEGYERALRLARVPRDFMAYQTPCCYETIVKAPATSDALTEICQLIDLDRVEEDPIHYFTGLFRKVIPSA